MSDVTQGPVRVVFMGTPEYALGSLDALHEHDGIEVVCVVTRPDAVSGRGKALVPSPVKARALELGYPVIETKTLRTAEVADHLRDLDADCFAVTAYGAIIPDEVLAMPRLGCLNVHASLLPAWRGAAPMQRAILAGDERVGYSVMRIESELDAGPWCVQGSVEVGERTYPEISAELSRAGGEALARVIADWGAGIAPSWIEQDHEAATFAPKIDKAELRLVPGDSRKTNMRRVQASSDAAPARCVIGGRGVRVMRAHLPEAGYGPVPQTARATCEGARLILGCQDGPLEVLEVKPDGKRVMSAREFIAGVRQTSDITWEALQ